MLKLHVEHTHSKNCHNNIIIISTFNAVEVECFNILWTLKNWKKGILQIHVDLKESFEN